VLVTLRLFLSNGEERLLSQEVADVNETPDEILERIGKDGRIPLGDRDSCRLEEIVKAEIAAPEPKTGPTLKYDGVRVRDEDVSAAMRGSFDRPPS